MMVSLLFALQEHEPTGGSTLPAPFQATPGLAIWQSIVFVLLLIVLARFIFPVLVKATADREARIAKDLADAERMRAEVAANLEEQRKLLGDARGEAQAILAEARSAAERDRSNAVEATRLEQEEMLSRARREIQAERERAVQELRREAVDIAIAAAGKVVGQRLDPAADRRMVEEFLATVRTSS